VQQVQQVQQRGYGGGYQQQQGYGYQAPKQQYGGYQQSYGG